MGELEEELETDKQKSVTLNKELGQHKAEFERKTTESNLDQFVEKLIEQVREHEEKNNKLATETTKQLEQRSQARHGTFYGNILRLKIDNRGKENEVCSRSQAV